MPWVYDPTNCENDIPSDVGQSMAAGALTQLPLEKMAAIS